MKPAEFVNKWARVKLRERAVAQEHFLDICRMLDLPTPAEADPDGEWFTFDKGLDKSTGGRGFADIWRKDCFAWENKGPGEDLASAYQQLQLYREDLGNPPLLVVCNRERFQVHTNFTNTVKRVYEFANIDLLSDRSVNDSTFTPLQVLRALFEDPQRLNPGKLQSKLTEEAADLLRVLADDMRKWNASSSHPVSEQHIAHFIMRMIFCFFASDVGLLFPEALTDLIRHNKSKPAEFRSYLSELFAAMKDGGKFLMRDVPHFNGGLFDDTSVPELISDQIALLERLNDLDWSDIEPSIFGTLFERIIDQDKRQQLGTHYTTREDIELIVEPVLMYPLRQAWEREKAMAVECLDWRSRAEDGNGIGRDRLSETLSRFLTRLASLRVLDPACGSGNFLYVSLSLLKALEKEVVVFGERYGIADLEPMVHPRQLFGIESNPYAQELASAVVWIGYLQWKYRNAFDLEGETPILEPLKNIALMDAILGHDENGALMEPEWPAADVVVGNPPFLGSKKLRKELGDDYVDALYDIWSGRVSGEADLCCYWFEKARSQVQSGRAGRVGLLATQAIRGGKNRVVLDRITETGGIFWAQSDRDWTLDGAAVHVSMVGFDNGSEHFRELDGLEVSEIYTNLRSGETDVTKARRLKENLGIAFMGDTKGGSFDIPASLAKQFLFRPNPDGRSNADVVRPWINADDITGRTGQRRDMWIIDFPPGTTLEDAALYEAPFKYALENVKPKRDISRTTTKRWWIHERPRVKMRDDISNMDRFIVTPRVSKHRSFIWLENNTLADSTTIVFARDDDYFFGVLHSRIHEVWARAQGSQLREVESGFRYTHTSTFETFPFPRPSSGQKAEIAKAARRLDILRHGWLEPPSETISPSQLKRRTLTDLYDDPPTWLDLAHCELDEAVFASYGWPPHLADGEILACLLALNFEREPA